MFDEFVDFVAAFLIVFIIVIFGLGIYTGIVPKPIATEYQDVEVVIVDVDYDSAWIQPIHVGKVTTFVTHSANYDVVVQYNGAEYTIDDEVAYEKYKSKVGETVTAKLEVQTYENGTVKYDVIEIY